MVDPLAAAAVWRWQDARASEIAGCYIARVTAIPTMQSAIATVDVQPSQNSPPWTTNFPMTFWFRTRIISKIITGAASTPLTTALQ